MVTDAQVQKYRNYLSKGLKLEFAAAKAGLDPKTARKWRTGPLPSEFKTMKGPRTWRTRTDPFANVWESQVVPLLQDDEEGVLDATFLFEYLREECPNEVPEGGLRTFQRRVADYRAIHGPPGEVFFPQVYRPGVTAQLDFTHISKLGVTVRGQPLNRIVFECILSYSGHRYVALAPSESYEALMAGVIGAFRAWGGATQEVVQDHLTAAIQNLKTEGGERYKVNARYEALLTQFGTKPRFIEVAKPNQNGVAERGHGVLKRLLEQSLKLRRSSDFESQEVFEQFLLDLVARLNRKRQDRWEEERKHLQALPASLPTTYSEVTARVSRWSLIQVKNNTLSVPSRLIGHNVRVRLSLDTLQIFYKDKLVETLPRPVGRNQVVLNYRHLVGSLVKKPGAFANYRYHEHMFPSLNFRKAYDALKASSPSKADVEYLRILKQAAGGMECDVEAAIQLHLEGSLSITSQGIREMVAQKEAPRCLQLVAPKPDLSKFDQLLSGETRERLTA